MSTKNSKPSNRIPWNLRSEIPDPGMRFAPPDGGWSYMIILGNCLNNVSILLLLFN